MPDWQPVAVPDLCPRCGAYWECEHASGQPKDFYEMMTPQITQRVMEERKLDQQFGALSAPDASVPNGVLEIAESMGISPKDVVDEMTKIQAEQAEPDHQFPSVDFEELVERNTRADSGHLYGRNVIHDAPQPDEVGCQINLVRGEHIGPCLGTCNAPS